MRNKFLFYKEYHDGKYFILDNLSKTKAKSLYNQTLKDWDLELKGCGWEEVQEPLTIQQQIRKNKTVDNSVGV